jgi:hypothetical protein
MFTNLITKQINGLPGWPYWDGLSASSTGQCRNAYTATGAPASGGAAADRRSAPIENSIGALQPLPPSRGFKLVSNRSSCKYAIDNTDSPLDHDRAVANSAEPRPPAAPLSLSFQAIFSNKSHAPACPSCGQAHGDVVEEPTGRLFDEIVGHGRKRDHSEKIADAQQIHQPHIFNVQQAHRGGR